MNIFKFYVYGYLRSKDSITGKAGTFYYFGKGCDVRAYRKHDNLPIPKDKSNIVMIAIHLSESESFILEKKLIAEYGRLDLGTGILRNLTDGGDGSSGYKHTKENLDKMSGENHHAAGRPKESHPMFGKTHTAESITKQSNSKLGEKNPMFGKKDAIVECPHCNRKGGVRGMKAHHFDKCKVKVVGSLET